jgi:predicted negative regulator of RcsB-dependent stress response
VQYGETDKEEEAMKAIISVFVLGVGGLLAWNGWAVK